MTEWNALVREVESGRDPTASGDAVPGPVPETGSPKIDWNVAVREAEAGRDPFAVSGAKRETGAIDVRSGRPVTEVMPRTTEPPSFLTLLKSGIVDDPKTKIKIFAKARGIPVQRYGIVDGEIVFKNDQGLLERETDETGADVLTRFVANQTAHSPAIVLGTAGSVAGLGPGGAAMGAAAGEGIRKNLAKYWLGEDVGGPEAAKDMFIEALTAAVGERLFGGGTIKAINANKTFRRGPLARAAGPDLPLIDNAATRANEELGQQFGVDLFPAQTTGSKRLIDKHTLMQDLPASADIMAEASRTQAGQVEEAIGREIASTGPDMSRMQTGEKITGAAKGAVQKAVDVRAAKAGPIYQKAFEEAPAVNIEPVINYIDERLVTAKGDVRSALESAKSMLMKPDIDDTIITMTKKGEGRIPTEIIPKAEGGIEKFFIIQETPKLDYNGNPVLFKKQPVKNYKIFLEDGTPLSSDYTNKEDALKQAHEFILSSNERAQRIRDHSIALDKRKKEIQAGEIKLSVEIPPIEREGWETVYHATNQEFSKFSIEEAEPFSDIGIKAHWFFEDKKHAKDYLSGINVAGLNKDKGTSPHVVTAMISKDAKLFNTATAKGKKEYATIKKEIGLEQQDRDILPDLGRMESGYPYYDDRGDLLIEKLKQRGYDGAYFDEGNGIKSIAVWNDSKIEIPNQYRPPKSGGQTILPTESSLYDTSLRGLHDAKMSLDSKISQASATGLGNTVKHEYQEVKRLLLGQMDEASSDYKTARKIFGDYSEEIKKQTNKTLTGDLAKLEGDKVEQAVGRLLDPKQSSVDRVMKAKPLIQAQNPEAWDAAIRQRLTDIFEGIKPTVQGETKNLAGRFHQAVMDKRQNAILKASMTTEQYDTLMDFSTVLKMAASVNIKESGTLSRSVIWDGIKEDLKGAGFKIAEFIENVDLTRPTRLIPGVQTVTGWIKTGSLEGGQKKLAQALTSPEASQQLTRLRQLSPGSEKFWQGFGTFMSLVAKQEVEEKVEKLMSEDIKPGGVK